MHLHLNINLQLSADVLVKFLFARLAWPLFPALNTSLSQLLLPRTKSSQTKDFWPSLQGFH